MDPLLFISLFLILLPAKAHPNTITSCSPINCANLNIQFPFRLQQLHPHHCGLPGFELYCQENNTILHFPSYGDLLVKSISYDLKKLDLLDPNNCVHQVFLNLNLSYTPFTYYYILKEYQYLNCSAQLSDSFNHVPCLSASVHYVYTVETSFVVPDFCNHVKTLRIPFSYSPFLSDNHFGLGLTWDLPKFQEEAGHHKRFIQIITDDKLLSGILLMLIVVLVFKLLHSKKLGVEKGKESSHADASLGDYEAVKPERESIASVKVLVNSV